MQAETIELIIWGIGTKGALENNKKESMVASEKKVIQTTTDSGREKKGVEVRGRLRI